MIRSALLLLICFFVVTPSLFAGVIIVNPEYNYDYLSQEQKPATMVYLTTEDDDFNLDHEIGVRSFKQAWYKDGVMIQESHIRNIEYDLFTLGADNAIYVIAGYDVVDPNYPNLTILPFTRAKGGLASAGNMIGNVMLGVSSGPLEPHVEVPICVVLDGVLWYSSFPLNGVDFSDEELVCEITDVVIFDFTASNVVATLDRIEPGTGNAVSCDADILKKLEEIHDETKGIKRGVQKNKSLLQKILTYVKRILGRLRRIR